MTITRPASQYGSPAFNLSNYGDILLNALIADRTGLLWTLGLVAMPRMPSRLRPFGGEHPAQPTTAISCDGNGACSACASSPDSQRS